MSEVKTVKIGIQDGNSDGMFEWGADIVNLDEERDPHYRPYWICEIPESDWEQWQSFLDDKDNYSGRSFTAWNLYWDSKTQVPRNSRPTEDNEED